MVNGGHGSGSIWSGMPESDGYKADDYRPLAWRYRDYVISSFNSDKPFNRFVLEQLAGDEIAAERSRSVDGDRFLESWYLRVQQP